MIRVFNIRDMNNKNKYMGTLRYNTDTKTFSIEVADSYKGCNPDFYMQKCKEMGWKQMPQWMVDMWIKQRLCPPNRTGIEDILEMAGLTEYDEMGLFDFNHGICCMDPYYFEEVSGMLEYRRKHDKYWKDYVDYMKTKGIEVR